MNYVYAPEVEELLKRKGIEPGNRVKVKKGEREYDGILMPRIRLGDTTSLIIKLDNGYNVAVRFGKDVTIIRATGGEQIRFKAAKASVEKDQNKPTISILGCGGTIASRVDYSTGAVFPAFSPDDMIASFPELKEVANVRGRKLFDLFSDDMTPSHWQIIAQEVAKEIKAKSHGVILMHGTDTMHYTAAALSFMLREPGVPVVLVGSQRSSDRGSSDNDMNLMCGTELAGKSDIAEVGVCMHGTTNDDYCLFHQGTKVRKLHTSRRDAFRSVNARPFAKVWYSDRRIEPLRDDYKRRNAGRFELDDRMNPRVGFVYNVPGTDPKFIESMAQHFDGIVVAATGLGHVSTNPKGDVLAKSIVPALKGLITSGIPVVFVPQTIYGRINLNVYEAGRILEEAGVIGNGCDWTPEAAFVKLMWVLGHTKDPRKVREMMLQNVAGELTERNEADTFLS